ncbi:hypothetical protein L345_13906, partial [Ophiophagus hannah]
MERKGERWKEVALAESLMGVSGVSLTGGLLRKILPKSYFSSQSLVYLTLSDKYFSWKFQINDTLHKLRFSSKMLIKLGEDQAIVSSSCGALCLHSQSEGSQCLCISPHFLESSAATICTRDNIQQHSAASPEVYTPPSVEGRVNSTNSKGEL